MYISRFSSYLFQTTHLFKTTAYENTPFEECNQRWLDSRDSKAPLHLPPCKQNPSSAWREAGGSGSCDFARPCLDSTPMLCGVHNYWRPCVTIWCLLRAATSVSSNKMACGRKKSGAAWVNRQSYLWWNTKCTEGSSSQANSNHLRSSILSELSFARSEFHTCAMIFKL